jgi:hypothetical protein
LEYRQTSLTLICLSLMPSGCVEYRQISLTLISRTGSYSSGYTCSQKLAMIKIIITKALVVYGEKSMTLECILLHNTFPSAEVFLFYISTLLMFKKPNKTTINKNKTTKFYRHSCFRFSFIVRYFKVFQVKRIVYI